MIDRKQGEAREESQMDGYLRSMKRSKRSAPKQSSNATRLYKVKDHVNGGIDFTAVSVS